MPYPVKRNRSRVRRVRGGDLANITMERVCCGAVLRVVLPFVAFCCSAASAQHMAPGRPTPPASQPQDMPTFRSKADFVLVPVIVRDAHGRPVGNLTKDDFQLFDKGKRQTIASFSAVQRANTNAERWRVNPAPEEKISSTPPVESDPAGISAASIRSERYVIYLFDDLNTEFANMAAVRKAASRHLEDLVPTDRAAIYTVSGHPTLDFSSDRDKLAETVRSLRMQSTVGHGGTECPDVSYFLADRIVNQGDDQAHRAVVQRTMQCSGAPEMTAETIASGAEKRELNIGEQDNRVLLRTLRSAVQRLSQMSGQRLIVMASPGFYTRTPQGIRAMAELLDQATRAHVVISAVDARGLYTLQPDATLGGPPSKLWQEYTRISADANKDVMLELTEGTGGTFVQNSDDLRASFDRVAAAPEFSYLLGFSPAELKDDGSFHALEIRVPSEKGLTVQARRGYYALAPETAEEVARSEIDEAVLSREQMSGIPVGLQTVFSKSDTSHAKLTAIAIVDIRSLHLQKIDGRNRGSLTMVSSLFDHNGRYVAGMIKTVNLGLRDTTVAHSGSEITVPWVFDVKPGTYEVRLVVREVVGGAMSACNSTVVIP
jgi:VWFA-related protein